MCASVLTSPRRLLTLTCVTSLAKLLVRLLVFSTVILLAVIYARAFTHR